MYTFGIDEGLFNLPTMIRKRLIYETKLDRIYFLSRPKQCLIPVIFLDQEGIGNIGVRKFML